MRRRQSRSKEQTFVSLFSHGNVETTRVSRTTPTAELIPGEVVAILMACLRQAVLLTLGRTFHCSMRTSVQTSICKKYDYINALSVLIGHVCALYNAYESRSSQA
jgi:hypothetical protein